MKETKLNAAEKNALKRISALCLANDVTLRERIDGIYRELWGLELQSHNSPVVDKDAMNISVRLYNIICIHFGLDNVVKRKIRLTDLAAVSMATWRGYRNFGKKCLEELTLLIDPPQANQPKRPALRRK